MKKGVGCPGVMNDRIMYMSNQSIAKDLIQWWQNLTPSERTIHASPWLIGLIIFNQPSLDWTIGQFHSRDFSLLAPSIYGAITNALIFYGNAVLLSHYLKTDKAWYWKSIVTLSVIILIVESLLDTLMLSFLHPTISDRLSEVVIDNFLMNTLFFYIPSFIYGFVLYSKEDREMSSDHIHVKSGNESFRIDPKDLMYLESDGNYTIYHSNRKILSRTTLSNAHTTLPPHFVRCHKSYIVNILSVEKYSFDSLSIANTKIPIGRRYKDEVKTSLEQLRS